MRAAPNSGGHSGHHRIRLAGALLRAGGVVAHPTEGVYGLACEPFEPNAVQRILDLKQRAAQAGFIVLAADLDAVLPWIDALPDPARWEQIRADWPGPVTWVMPAAPDVPDWLTGGRDTLAVRVTAHPLSAALCAAAGGLLLSTSANPSGKTPARTALRVRRYFPRGVDMILGGPTGGRSRPTPIRDARTGETLRA